MTAQESQVLLARIDGVMATIARVEADILRLDERQRKAAASLARLEERVGTQPPSQSPLKTHAATAGGFAVMLALVEVIRALVLGG